MLTINTNLASLVAQSSLNSSTNKLNQAIERMTTGFKINHASDNAANYSITTNMSTKISAYEVAEENVSMGLDLITTASESLVLISDKLARLRALQEQSINGTYGEDSLKAINAEVNSLIDEISRIYSTTNYNGIQLFGETPPITAKLLEEIEQRDTSSMTTLSSVDETSLLAVGTYSISTAEELAKLAAMQNAGLISDGSEFVLGADIDLSAYSYGEGWTPIGTTSNNAFQGTFDGNGYVISNLYINRPFSDFQGLFGYVASREIKNLGMEDASISGGNSSGILAGSIFSCDIKNCYTSGRVAAENSSGGLVGTALADFTIDSCYSTGIITGCDFIGGLIGDPDLVPGLISNCYSICDISGRGYIGGLVGYCTTDMLEITNSYAIGSVSGSSSYVGNFLGYDYCNKISWDNMLDLSNGVPFCYKSAEEINITLQVGIDSSFSNRIILTTSFALTGISSLRNIGLNTTADYLSAIDSLIETVSGKQAEYGSVENRLESVLEEIQTRYDKLVSSRSTLRDADIAEVSSEYIKQQILQQASATLLATANQTPALALQLL